MKARTVILAALVTLVCLGSVTSAQSGGAGPAPEYVVQAMTSVGGTYQLASLPLRQTQGDAWQVSGTATGAGYVLTIPSAPALRGSGCCCTHLPCALRDW
ncbi:MAG: hypothetical protein JXM73_24595 [Anaerolineae bacterium]|nr:hypothetical protein [Anaerolineae bacterium]